METNAPTEASPAAPVGGDSIVCFCYRRTLGELKQAYQRLGSLEKLQEETKAGLGCGGCRALLNYHFNENPAEIIDYSLNQAAGATVCAKPGNQTMKCFIISNRLLESRAFSCNAVPLQFGSCDASMTVDYSIYDHRGQPVLTRSQPIATGETFTLDTATAGLPRPFYGMIAYRVSRQNLGASRLNVAWYTDKSNTSTHENPSSGRPDVVLPIPVDRNFLKGPNRIYLAVQNPHGKRLKLNFRLFPLAGGNLYDPLDPPSGVWRRIARRLSPWKSTQRAVQRQFRIPAMGTLWIDANRELYAPALRRMDSGPVLLRMHTNDLHIHSAPSIYFFMHHRPDNIWSVNHL